MKKIKMIILMTMTVLILISCGDNTETSNDRLDELIGIYDEVGVDHNIKLDNMLSVYRSQQQELTKARCRTLADGYFVNAGNSAARINELIYGGHELSKSTANSDVVDILADSIEIFSEYPDIFDAMSNILDAQLSVNDKIDRLESIYLTIDETVTNDNDKTSLMNGLSTTIHSLSYWNENYEEWQSVLGPDLGKTTIGIAGAIGIIDGAGAVMGTLEGIRDTYKGQDGRGRIIVGRAIGEAAKTSTYAILAIILI